MNWYIVAWTWVAAVGLLTFCLVVYVLYLLARAVYEIYPDESKLSLIIVGLVASVSLLLGWVIK